MEDADAILAYQATSAVDAHALVAYLANAGIESRVLGESLQGAYGGIKLGDMDLPEVWVAGKDRDAAEPIIAAWRNEHRGCGVSGRPTKFQFSLLSLLLTMAAVAWLATAMTLGADASSAVTSLLMAFLLIVCILAYRDMRVRKSDGDEKNGTKPW